MELQAHSIQPVSCYHCVFFSLYHLVTRTPPPSIRPLRSHFLPFVYISPSAAPSGPPPSVLGGEACWETSRRPRRCEDDLSVLVAAECLALLCRFHRTNCVFQTMCRRGGGAASAVCGSHVINNENTVWTSRETFFRSWLRATFWLVHHKTISLLAALLAVPHGRERILGQLQRRVTER